MQANTKLLLLLLSFTSACSLIGKVVPIGTDTRDINADRQRQADKRDAETKRLADGRPQWCKDFNVDVDVELDQFKGLDEYLGQDASKFAAVMCAATGEHHELKPKVMEIRAAWMKRHGLDERDFLALVAGGDEQEYDKFDGPVGQIGKFGQRGGAELLDQWGPRASMLARVAYVKNCLDEGISNFGHEDTVFLDRLNCTREPLDAAKANAEIEAEKKLDAYSRTRLRQMVFNTIPKLAKARAEIAAQAKDDPGIAQIVAIADAQRKEWASITPERQKLIAELERMEAATAANKRSAFAGCEDRTYAAWAAAVKGVKITGATFEGTAHAVMPQAFRTTEQYLAYKAFMLCAAGAGIRMNVNIDATVLKRRGPRSATMAAVTGAHDTIKMDNKEHDRFVPRSDYYISGGRVVDGTIAKLTPKGDSITIAFKPELYKSNDCVQSKQTGEIDYYTNGSPFMKTVCVRHAIVQHDSSPDEVSVPALLAKGLKPGMTLLVTEDGFPIVAMNKRDGTASWVLGAPVN